MKPVLCCHHTRLLTCVVGNDGVLDALLPELPRRQESALVAGACLVHPHVHVDPGLLRCVDWARGCAVVRKRQPPFCRVGSEGGKEGGEEQGIA